MLIKIYLKDWLLMNKRNESNQKKNQIKNKINKNF